MGNQQALDDAIGKINEQRQQGMAVSRVVITSSASPEGTTEVNRQVAASRAKSLADYLAPQIGFDASKMEVVNRCVDWNELQRLAQNDKRISSNHRLIRYINKVINDRAAGDSASDATIKANMQNISEADYHYMRRHLFPKMRYAKAHVEMAKANVASADTKISGQVTQGVMPATASAYQRPDSTRLYPDSVNHIDGFRFDLMGCHDIETMNQIRQMVNEIDPTIFIYGEGWSAGSCALPNDQLGMKANIPQMPGIAAFSDEIRDALRGPFSDDTKPGWLGFFTTRDYLTTTRTTKTTHCSHDSDKEKSCSGCQGCRQTDIKLSSKEESELSSLEESLKFGIVGCIRHPQVDMSKVNYSKAPWAVEPTQMMSYVSCHDDMCLVDRLKASIPNLTEDELIRLDLLAQTAVFTSQGVPFMLSGEELLRNKKGVHNSFESPDSINQLDWQNKLRYPQVFEYYKNLIQLRKHFPHFRLANADQVRQKVQFLDTPKGVVAYRIEEAVGCIVTRVIVVLNSTRQEQLISVPEANYAVVCANGVIDLNGIDTFRGNQLAVAPQSAMIIHD